MKKTLLPDGVTEYELFDVLADGYRLRWDFTVCGVGRTIDNQRYGPQFVEKDQIDRFRRMALHEIEWMRSSQTQKQRHEDEVNHMEIGG